VNADLEHQQTDPRLALLCRASARLLLFEAGELDLDEACEDIVADDWTFSHACDRADRRARRRREDPELARLRHMLEDDVSLDRAYAALNSDRLMPEATIEALIYSCRQGPPALDQPDNVRRFGQLSERELREVYGRVQGLSLDLQHDGKPAVRWTAEQADALLDKWNACHG
jgi:hypothetical protein